MADMGDVVELASIAAGALRSPVGDDQSKDSKGGKGSLLYLLQVASQAFPVGSFSHSYGFESLIHDGYIEDASDLARIAGLWIRYGLASADAAGMRLARQAAEAGDWAAVGEIDGVLTAIKLGRESRAASLNTGDAFVRAVLDAFGGERLGEYRQAIRAGQCAGHYATCFGVAMVDAGIDEGDAVAAFLQSSFSSLVAVAARIIPLGQFETQRILADARPVLTTCARVALETGLADLGTSCAILDVASMQHERLYSRLCIS